MSGIPVDVLVDVLVDIDGSNNNSISANAKCFETPDFDDDPFEMCSKQQLAFEKDLGFQLGLALEKSIKLHSQDCENLLEPKSTTEPNQTKLGILVNLDESPDKNPSYSKQCIRQENLVGKDADSGFDSPANPFQLAWDVIQQEALNLADNILKEKDRPISPRKMIDLAMKLSPDSLLLSPRHDKKEEEILINSSPEIELKKTPKVSKPPQFRGRPSVGGSPLTARNYATPLRTQPRMSINASPASKLSKLVAQSPASKTISQRAVPVKPPLFRSSSAMAPISRPLLAKTLSAKAAPVKAAHPSTVQPGTANKSNSNGQQRNTQPVTPLRRPASTSSTPSELRLPSLNLASKLRAASSRSEHDPLQQPSNKVPESAQRNVMSVRPPLRRTTGVNQQTTSNLSKPPVRPSLSLRGRPRGRESIAP